MIKLQYLRSELLPEIPNKSESKGVQIWLQTFRIGVSNNVLIVFLLFSFMFGFCLFIILLFPLTFINIYYLLSTAAVWWAATYKREKREGDTA